MHKSMGTKTHYKMYKSGKAWVIAGIVTGCLAVGGVTAQADEQGTTTTETAVVTQPATSTPVANTAGNDASATETPAGEAPVAEAPETEGSVSETPVAETPPVETPETPVTEAPTPEAPATGDSAVDTPVSEVPTPEAPTVEAPATSTTDTPTVDTPATDTPAAEAPASEGPVGETPTATAPVVDTPVIDESIDDATQAQDATTSEMDSSAAETVTKPAFDEEVVATPTAPVTPEVTTPAVVSEAPTASVDTVPMTRPVVELARPVQPEMLSTMGASHTTAAVAMVQAEMLKPATMKETHAPTATTIDDWMPNKVLQQAVLLHLQRLTGVDKQWHSVADITQEDLQLLKKLLVLGNDGFDTYIDGHTAFSLEGLQYATNLETIMMEASLNHKPGAFFGDIVDVSPLANLQHLTTVHLQHNRIEDVTPLANLQNVTSMALAYNHIHDFSPLKGKPYEDFTYTGQFIFLDPLMVNDADREGHLQIQCTTINGDVVTLTAGMALAEPVFYTDEAGHTYHVYYTGGNPKPDGQGGIYYTNIQNQKPGATEFPGAPNVAVLPDYYYLTGNYKPSPGVVDFAVVQPYVISHAANNVTVHYQDQEGNPIADDVVLKPGLVGEHYTTTAPELPGYTLTTTPENANGTYSDEAIDVTYVYALVEDGDEDTNTPGETPGGETPGGETPGGEAPGGETPGGETPGGETPGGETPGGETPGCNTPGETPGETPGGNTPGEQPGTGGQDDNGSEGDGVVSETPGGNQPGTSQPESPVADDEGSSEAGTEGDTVSTGQGTSNGSTGGTTTTVAHTTAGHPVQLATGQSAATAETAPANDNQLGSGLVPDALPQTDEQATSPVLGVALLAGLFGFLGFKLKRKHE
ncbi:MucBP domain-containing protein [Levilactobacillus sp. HBUAS70063]|uniref:MucBP domain-containing protein n=1 Tax=Levilactobacillus sp. HBUAS70063 TaxID=3109359 RepID=UPI003132C53B